MRTRSRPVGSVLFTVAAVALAGCGGGSGSKNGASGQTATSAAADNTATTEAPSDCTASLPDPNGGKPTVTVPAGPPPTTLQVKDISVGTGATAVKGSKACMQYVGVAYSTKQEFDTSWDRGQPFPFTVGAGQVIHGWDQGVPGMKVGGRRELIIPPALGYGPDGTPDGTIGPDETLVFVIDLLKVS